jgi:hypothetical protein
MNIKPKKIVDLSIRSITENTDSTVCFSPAIASPSAKFIGVKTPKKLT